MADEDFREVGEVAAELERQAGSRKAPDRPGASDRGPREGPQMGPTLKADGSGKLITTEPPVIKALPPDAPVRALGTWQNKVYFLDAHNQLRELSAKDLNRTMILHLFGDQTDAIYDLWPTLKKAPGGDDIWYVTGWDGTKAQESLMRACARKSIWRPQEHVRGRGTWLGPKGGLVVHSGHRLYFSDGKTDRPGLVGTQVYPAATRSITPAEEDETLDGQTAASYLLGLLETWNWAREFDARLLLGWIAASMLAGALKVRPLTWVTGEKGTGKSSLVGERGVIHNVFGPGILMTANTTAAGLYQKIEYDALPVAIDEIEAKRGNQKTEAVIELARQAYSGGMVLRGGADHEGKEFRAMCPVLFGSILIPPLLPQDMSRLALLNLRPFDADAKEPEIDEDYLGRVGRAMMRRLLTRWKDWPERLETWHSFLRKLGHSGRAADQFGTLLAAADLALCDNVPDEEEMHEVAGTMAPMNLAETQVESSNASRCVGYAMSRPVRSQRGGEEMMVSELITCAVRRYGGEMSNPVKPINAVRYLERVGVSVMVQKIDKGEPVLMKPHRIAPVELNKMLNTEYDGGEVGIFVAFAPDGDGILELFRGSDWEGAPGAHNPYVQALGRVTGARKGGKSVRLGARTCRPILIPISECVDVPSEKEAATGQGYDQEDGPI